MARKKIRYAVVGLGHIAQVAILPAFQHAADNSELVALVSSDQTKLRRLGKRYDVSLLHTYDRYDELMATAGSTPSSSLCRITSMPTSPCARPDTASTSCVKSRWPSRSESASR